MPGASRMYPETDIPSISVMPEEVKLARDTADKTPTWDEAIAKIQKKYNLNKDTFWNKATREYKQRFSSVDFIASSGLYSKEGSGISSMVRMGLSDIAEKAGGSGSSVEKDF